MEAELSIIQIHSGYSVCHIGCAIIAKPGQSDVQPDTEVQADVLGTTR